jgi:AcrR family transcriptional regulator
MYGHCASTDVFSDPMSSRLGSCGVGVSHPGIPAARPKRRTDDAIPSLERPMAKMRLSRIPILAPRDAITPNPARTPRGRNALQDQQQRTSRQKILDAGAAVFGRKSYLLATVEDIIAEAGVSRVTFYKHFENKFSLAKELTDERIVPFLLEHYNRLADRQAHSIEDICDWIASIVGIFSQNKALIALLQGIASIEPGYDRIETSVHSDLIRRLGKGIPAFKAAATARPGTEIHVRAHLLMRQLDRLCYDLGVNQWATDQRIAIRLQAEQFRRFIEEGAISPSDERAAAPARRRTAKSS